MAQQVYWNPALGGTNPGWGTFDPNNMPTQGVAYFGDVNNPSSIVEAPVGSALYAQLSGNPAYQLHSVQTPQGYNYGGAGAPVYGVQPGGRDLPDPITSGHWNSGVGSYPSAPVASPAGGSNADGSRPDVLGALPGIPPPGGGPVGLSKIVAPAAPAGPQSFGQVSPGPIANASPTLSGIRNGTFPGANFAREPRLTGIMGRGR